MFSLCLGTGIGCATGKVSDQYYCTPDFNLCPPTPSGVSESSGGCPAFSFDKADAVNNVSDIDPNLNCFITTRISIENQDSGEKKEITRLGTSFESTLVDLNVGNNLIKISRSYNCPLLGNFEDLAMYSVKVVESGIKLPTVIPPTCEIHSDCGDGNYCLDIDADGVNDCVDSSGNKIQTSSITGNFAIILNKINEILSRLFTPED